MPQFTKQLTEFIGSKSVFKVVFQSKSPDSPLYILDSSFNPPHYGHLELIKSAPSIPKHVLLLLSLNNADKPPVPASFDQRLDMMNEFGKTLGLDYSICISKSPKFIDKSLEINHLHPSIEKHYLLGYDTLIRILDQKYYQDPIEIALNDFMLNNKFICLTRTQDYLQQLEYLEHLSNGKLELPTQWRHSITLIKNDQKTNTISSSEIRKRVGDGKPIEDLTTNTIREYIKHSHLYED